MYAAILFHDTPITGKTKVTDLTENTQSRILIFKGKPSLFQYVYLLGEGDRLFCIFHIQKKRPTLVRWSCDEKRGGICWCKGTAFIRDGKTF